MSESEYVDRTPLDDPAWVIALVEERDALRTRAANLEDGLRRYLDIVELYAHGCCDAMCKDKGHTAIWDATMAARALLPAPAPGRDTTTSRDLAAGGNDEVS